MHLLDYLKQERGRASSLARALGVTPVQISHWAHGIRTVPAEHCPAIERETGGEVRCEDLRPDVDWSYLRGRAVGGAQMITSDPADPDANRIAPPVETA